MVGPFWGKKATEDFRGPRWSASILGRLWRARQNARAPSVRAAFGRLQLGSTPPWARGAPEDDFRANRHGGPRKCQIYDGGPPPRKAILRPQFHPPPSPGNRRLRTSAPSGEIANASAFLIPTARGVANPHGAASHLGEKHGSNGQRKILGTPGGTRRFWVRFTTPDKSPLLQAGRWFFGAPKSRKPCPGEGRHQKCRFPRIAAKWRKTTKSPSGVRRRESHCPGVPPDT